jgi:outer membrane protein assembly factor BamE (lipoprotein component of BamABCDE complex)
MKRFAISCAALLIGTLLVFLAVDAFRSKSAIKRATVIRIGDSKQQVKRVLGRPSDIGVAGFFDHSETWAYGGYMDWQGVTFRLRLFGPEDNEVAVQFDKAGKVSQVFIPKK